MHALSVKRCVVEKIVIVGGGLAGLAAAIQLRNHGIDAHVYEKNSSVWGGKGTMISISPNGCRALNEANPELVVKMKKEGLSSYRTVIMDTKGETVGELQGSQAEEIFKQPLFMLPWQSALRILSEALPDACKHYGYECYDVTQEGDEAVAHFNFGDDKVHVKAPLVIGADGLRSQVRSATFGFIPLCDGGRTLWRAVIDANLCSHKFLVESGAIRSSDNSSSVFVVNGVHGKLYWAFSKAEGESARRSDSPMETKERVLGEFNEWELATHIIQATDPELILERRFVDIDVLPKWSKGAVVLIGDAAHAVTPAVGQGANLSFEDGSELAFQLSSCSDLRTALNKYEEIRIPRAKLVLEISRRSVANREKAGGNHNVMDFQNKLYSYAPDHHLKKTM